MKNLKNKFVNGTIWSLILQISYIIVLFITNLVYTRFLSPSDFGIVGIIMFFIIILGILVEGGFGGALVRKDKVTLDDYFTVFTVSFLLSIVFFILIVISSSGIASYYQEEKISIYLKIASIVLVFNAFQIVPTVKLVRALNFKTRGICRLLAILISSLVGVFFAYKEYGVWAVIINQILYSFFFALFLNFTTRFSFRFTINMMSLKEVFNFGIYTSITSLLNSFFENVYQVIIGKYFGIYLSGLYYQSKRLQDVPINLINMLFQGVVFSTLSKIKNDNKKYNIIYLKFTTLVSVFMGGILITFFVLGKDILYFFYGTEWVKGYTFLLVLILISFFYIQELLMRTFLKVENRTKKILKIDLVKKICQIIFIIMGIFLKNINLLLIGYFISGLISYFIYLKITNEYLIKNSRVKEIMIIFFIALVLCISVLLFKFKMDFFYLSLLWIFNIVLYLYVIMKFKVFNLYRELCVIRRSYGS